MSLHGTPRVLNNTTLSELRRTVRTPAYDRSQLNPSIVHIGVGGFHRAHQAVYLDDLLSIEGTERWGECGIGLLPGDKRMRDALRPQDCLYTVVARGAKSEDIRIIGSIMDYVYAQEDREAAIERMAAAQTHIVSLTITEGGYFVNEGSGEFTAEHPDIQHDLEHPHEPATALGFIAEGLDRRRRRGLRAFTVMSCDNLQSNGHVIERVLLAFAELREPALREWIADHVAFPNSMVDRITPSTTARDISYVRDEFGLQDAWPVVTEPFMQWVIEENFCNGRPQWEKVGAQLVSDVAPYELMKMRLLNGSHMAMAYLGALVGYTYVHEVLQDALFLTFIERFMDEVTPVVPTIPGTSVYEYKKLLIERFSNPTIHDQVTRICSEGSAKLPKWVLPSITELTGKGKPIDLLSLVVASWMHYLKLGRDENGKTIEIVDARSPDLTNAAKLAGTNPRLMLSASLFGSLLPGNLVFVKRVEEALVKLSELGVRATMEYYLSAYETAR